MNDNPIPFETVRKMFSSGDLWKKDVPTLNRCLRGLATRAEENPYIRHHHIIIASTIHGILVERLIESIDRRNTILTYVLIVIGIIAAILAGLALIG
jgi:hypothetical protein